MVGRLGVTARVVVRLQAVPKDRAEDAVEIKDDEEPVVAVVEGSEAAAAPPEARSKETALRVLCMSATEGCVDEAEEGKTEGKKVSTGLPRRENLHEGGGRKKN